MVWGVRSCVACSVSHLANMAYDLVLVFFVEGLGCGFWVLGSDFRVEGLRLWVQSLKFRV